MVRRDISKTFDSTILKNVHINKQSVHAQIDKILSSHPVTTTDNVNKWLLKAVSVIDLTTLSGDDTRSNVIRLCSKAAKPLAPEILKKLNLPEGQVRTAAVCVYPNRVCDAYKALTKSGLVNDIQIASVATGFPSGLYPLHTRIEEIKFCIKNGATEIDVVLDRSLVLTGKWGELFNEVLQMRQSCGDQAHLKVILGVGELGTYENVYKASIVSMFAGADFIKTSTGKEAVNATLPVGLVMCRAIRHYYQLTGVKVGLKPAGGIKTPRDAINWLVLIHSELGADWLTPKLFRIGASSLLDVIEKHLDQNTKVKDEKDVKTEG